MTVVQPQEVRIGNWVSNGEKNYTVDVNLLYDMATNETFPIYPIPITPEILEASGFKNEKLGNISSCDYTNGILTLGHISIYNEWQIIINKRTLILSIQYLHQLQNLIFALTGEELQIIL